MTPPDEPDLLRMIDAVVRHRALVFGSLPPEGRDLDLLVRHDDAAAIAARLRDEGFRAWGRGWAWVSFRGCSASVVELIPAAKLRLPQAELDALFAEANAVAPLRKVVEPAPHHTLLILARKLTHEPAGLLPKYRARIDRALAKDPAAWEQARSRAELWAAGSALARLESLYTLGRPRLRWRSLVRRPRRTRLIALSSADADRTRSHAESLRETLDRLGFDSVVERPDPPRMRRRPAGSGGASRIRPGALAVASALSLWRPVWRHLARGRVLIYDRSALDSAVLLSAEGTTAAEPTLAVMLLRILSPPTLRSYLLDAANLEDGDVPNRRAEAYRASSTAFAAGRLDASHSREELCEEIAEDVWRALTRRTRLVSAIRDAVAVVRHRRGAEAESPSV
jgi:hypothetical protein